MSESESAKQAAVVWVHEQMERHGLTFEDLVEAGCFADAHIEVADQAEAVAKAATPTPDAPPRVMYRNAMGQTWDGNGEYHDWLQRAVNAGQSIDFYRVE